MAFGSSLELDIVPAKEKGETSEMPTMKIKKESRKPLGTSQNLFLLPKQASKLQMRNEDHYDFMPGIHWPHVETNPVREMRNIGRPSDMQRVKFKFYYYYLLVCNYIAALLLGV